MWAQHLEDLAAATTQLLVQGALQPKPLIDPNVAMAARDAPTRNQCDHRGTVPCCSEAVRARRRGSDNTARR